MTVAEVVKKMVEYSKGDLHDISHFMKVYAYAKTIAEGENLSPEQQKLVEVTAVVHDIACPLCRVKYGNANGKHQEEESAALLEEFSCLCFEYFFQHVSHIVSGKITLICIYQIICLYHNLIINTIDSGYCMMMTYNIRNTIYKFFRQSRRTSGSPRTGYVH